ncbi:MAG: YidC/Oxa1 family rane protein insertase, partial [Methylobacteriaceae bacterium]|nr:YidC/Oxa1 family rane protein insertase [Methylobacteriaceae bacterium]
MIDNRNTILAVILSGLVLIGWQYFFNIPQMEKQRAAQQAQSEMVKPAPQATPGTTTPQTGAAPAPQANAPANPSALTQPASAAPPVDRDVAIAGSPRVKIDTPSVIGSISL